MKLKKYDSSLQSTRTGEPRISFDDKGVIRINKTAVEALGLKPGDKIAFLMDEENPTDWYITKDKEGFPTIRCTNDLATIPRRKNKPSRRIHQLTNFKNCNN